MSAETENWKLFYEDGEKFLKTAVSPGKKKVFLPEIIYNVTCMAIEKFFMAFFMRRGTMPDNHTMRDLAESAQRVTALPPELKDNMLFLDSFQNICVLSQYVRKIPGKEDMERVIKTGILAKAFVDSAMVQEGGNNEKTSDT